MCHLCFNSNGVTNDCHYFAEDREAEATHSPVASFFRLTMSNVCLFHWVARRLEKATRWKSLFLKLIINCPRISSIFHPFSPKWKLDWKFDWGKQVVNEKPSFFPCCSHVKDESVLSCFHPWKFLSPLFMTSFIVYCGRPAQPSVYLREQVL